jgi:hypothetical protein
MAYTERRASQRRRRTVGSLLLPPLALFFAVVLAAAIYVAYVLWPRWPGAAVAPDAPALPIIIAGVTFNVPPGAIRVAVQRRPGAQARIDLVFLWPSLAPPAPAGKAATPAMPEVVAHRPTDRLFVTITPANDTLAPIERFKTIYPRYTENQPANGPLGLAVVTFRDGTPYRGEELIYDVAAPEKFLARCTKYDRGPTRGTCLTEHRVGAADIMVRFPRDWLSDWRAVVQGVDKLIASLRPFSG